MAAVHSSDWACPSHAIGGGLPPGRAARRRPTAPGLSWGTIVGAVTASRTAGDPQAASAAAATTTVTAALAAVLRIVLSVHDFSPVPHSNGPPRSTSNDPATVTAARPPPPDRRLTAAAGPACRNRHRAVENPD